MGLVVICGEDARSVRGRAEPGAVVLPALPGRADLDPLVDRLPGPGGGAQRSPTRATARLVVAGPDAALAAVLVRLLRRERLDVELAFLPLPGSVAASVWGIPTAPEAALALARESIARPAPLVRDDRGGLVVGRHRAGPFLGEVYCDERRLWSGEAAGLEVRPDPAGTGAVAAVTGPRRLAGLRAGLTRAGGGRAVQLGCRPVEMWRDDVPDERTVTRRSWYRHLEDWWLVRPDDVP